MSFWKILIKILKVNNFDTSCICECNQCNSPRNKLIVLIMSINAKDVLEIPHKWITDGVSCFEDQLLLVIHLHALQFYDSSTSDFQIQPKNSNTKAHKISYKGITITNWKTSPERLWNLLLWSYSKHAGILPCAT